MGKFPFYKQLDAMDCGPTCLRMIARHYGKKFSVQQLREQSFIQRTGVNLLGISEAAASIGMRTTGVRTTLDKLKTQCKLPCILHWNQVHFVVLYRVEHKRGKWYFYIADPAYGLLKYEEEELKRCWISTRQGGEEKGIALLLDVTPRFYETEPEKFDRLSLWYLTGYVRPYRKALVQLLLGMLAGSVLQLVFPFLTQTIVDQGIGHRNLNFIQLILVAQLMLVFSRTLIEVIRRCIQLIHLQLTGRDEDVTVGAFLDLRLQRPGGVKVQHHFHIRMLFHVRVAQFRQRFRHRRRCEDDQFRLFRLARCRSRSARRFARAVIAAAACEHAADQDTCEQHCQPFLVHTMTSLRFRSLNLLNIQLRLSFYYNLQTFTTRLWIKKFFLWPIAALGKAARLRSLPATMGGAPHPGALRLVNGYKLTRCAH